MESQPIHRTQEPSGRALRLGDITDTKVVLPPRAEQHRIVAKIDSLLARSSRARDELAHIPRLIERYRQAVLEAAFRGDAIAGWSETSLDEIVTDSRVGLVRSKAEQRSEGGIPYIRMQHYDVFGRWNSDNLTYVDASKDEYALYELASGDLLFNTRNSYELVGKMAIWPKGRDGYLYNNNILRLRFSPDIDPRFVMLALRGSYAAEQLEAAKSATTSVAAIYQRDLMSCRIPFPQTREAQARIVDQIEAKLAAIDTIEQALLSSATLIDRLDQSILDRAFTGKLVPQDPADEPASKLLDRIKATRESAPKAKRGRRSKG